MGATLIGAARSQAIVMTVVSAALFVAQVGVGRRFGLDGLGEYTATSLAIYLTSIVVLFALPLTANRAVGNLLEHGDNEGGTRTAGNGLTLVLALGALGAVLLAAVWAAWAARFFEGAVAPAVVAAAVVGSALLSYGTQIQQAHLRISAAGLIVIAQPLAVVAALGWDTVAPGVRPGDMAAAGFLLGGAAGATGLWMSGIRPQLDDREIRQLLRGAVSITPVVYTNVLSIWVDRLVVSVLLGPVALGTYQAAGALVEGSLRLLRGAGAFFISAYGRAAARSDEHTDLLRRLNVRAWSAYAAVMAGGLIAGADGIVTTLYGRGFANADDPLRLLAVAMVPTAVSLTLLTAGAGLELRSALLIARLAIPAQVALGIAGAATFGVAGVAVAQVAVTIPVAAAQLYWSRDAELAPTATVGGRIALLAMLVPLIGSAASLLPVVWPVRVALGGAGSAAIALLLVLGPQERVLVRRLVGLWV